MKRPCYTSDVCIFLQSGWGQHLANDTEGFFSNGKHRDLPPSPLADAGFDKGPEEVKNAKKRIRGQLLGDARLGSDQIRTIKDIGIDIIYRERESIS